VSSHVLRVVDNPTLPLVPEFSVAVGHSIGDFGAQASSLGGIVYATLLKKSSIPNEESARRLHASISKLYTEDLDRPIAGMTAQLDDYSIPLLRMSSAEIDQLVYLGFNPIRCAIQFGVVPWAQHTSHGYSIQLLRLLVTAIHAISVRAGRACEACSLEGPARNHALYHHSAEVFMELQQFRLSHMFQLVAGRHGAHGIAIMLERDAPPFGKNFLEEALCISTDVMEVGNVFGTLHQLQILHELWPSMFTGGPQICKGNR